ncbi:MAG: type II secretion system F family protein [Verrucomicrobiota bacterium]
MPVFSYTALDTTGAEMTGLLDAADAREVAALLRARGLFPTGVEPRDRPGTETGEAGRRTGLSFALPFLRLVGARELAVFTRQLGTLLRAGMPLLKALETLARQQCNGRFRHVVESLAEGIKTGDTLSVAMARHPRVFDRLCLSMIKAGEAGGTLDTVLDRLARFQEKSLHVRGKVVAAMVYPAVVLGVAAVILAGLLVFVVPKFRLIFADLLKGAPLPPLTRVVLGVSDAVRQHVLLAAGLAVLLWIGFRVFRRTPVGTRLVDTLIVRLPLFGDLFLKAVIARFGRTFGTLLSSGVPILPALLITRDTTGNARVAAAIMRVHDRVKEGAPVARPLEATRVFPPMVTSMIEVGEHSGQLPEMLNKVADICEEEVDNAVAGLSSLIEPILILFLALVVGTIVIALFMPIIRIVQLLT